jgi:DNA repair protein RecN (Recombination protein N)
MLKLLNISNLAVIDSLQLEFGSGLNILSGETGSGKSIVIDALGILSGNRVTQEVIRTGEERAFVEGVFDVSGNTPLLSLLSDSGIAIDEDEMVIKREIVSSGRGRVFVNNQSATTLLLKAIQPHIIDIHGQGDQQSLLVAENHLKIFDSFIAADTLRQQVEATYEELLALIRELESSQRTEAEQLQMLDLLEYQINEISKAEVKTGEDAELESERKILANAERLATLCDEAYKIIYDNEESTLAQLSTAQKKLEELTLVDEKFGGYKEQVLNARYALEDAAYFIRNYVESIDVSPNRLREVEERLVEIERLKRKYGPSIETIINVLRQAEEKRFNIKNSELRTQELVEKIKAKIVEYQGRADVLSQKRAANSKKFEALSSAELAKVSFEHASFRIKFAKPSPTELNGQLEGWIGAAGKEKAISRLGQEMLEFYFSANTGEEMRPLRDVASGGELSRLMLVLKTIIAPTQFPKTLIFDEIDSGIGGRVADAVGLRLSKLAKTNQVLCVTHQAQIARYADAHFLISKDISGKRTKTSAILLDHNGQVEELARMLAGSEITNTAKKHAREMLKSS